MDEVFSKPVRAAQVKEAPQSHEVVADAAQCAALARLFGLPGISRLRGNFVLRHQQGGVIAADLHLQAGVTQLCVITLEPFEAAVEERAALRFIPARQISEAAEIGEVDAETLEGPDEIPYAGETIDLGAALAEQLALSLDPYPRKPGAALAEDAAAAPLHPFAALLRRRDGNDAGG